MKRASHVSDLYALDEESFRSFDHNPLRSPSLSTHKPVRGLALSDLKSPQNSRS